MSPYRTSGLAPWSGFFLGFLAWGLDHQVGSSLVFADCRLGGPLLTLGLGAVCAVVAISGGALSWLSRHPGSGEAQTRRFAALLSLSAAGLFLLAIFLQSLSGLIIPACHR
jgi:hypothetical protein